MVHRHSLGSHLAHAATNKLAHMVHDVIGNPHNDPPTSGVKQQ
jgi:hypothetical protein